MIIIILAIFSGIVLYYILTNVAENIKKIVPARISENNNFFEEKSLKLLSIEPYNPTEEPTEEPSIIVKEPYFNVSKIKNFFNPGDGARKFIFRPRTLEEYIGQEKAKKLIRLNIKKILELKPVHILISGHRGCGKTTLTHIIKNKLNANMIERIGGELTNPEQIVDLVNEINVSEGRIILFIDEIHALDAKLCETFYPIMEDFKIAGREIKPFIFIGATTEKNILMKKVAPFVDRFQVQVELEKYSEEDIVAILKQYKEQLFPNKELSNINYYIIAKNSRLTPRMGITLLEDNLIEKDIRQVLECHRIVKNGITDIDLKILQILEENNRPIGSKSLSRMIGISQADYEQVYENFLTEQEYIIPTSRGRVLGEKGKLLLESIKEKL